MTISPDGVKLIQSFEDCPLSAYQDIKGIWTIGWGTTGSQVYPGLTITQQQADAYFLLGLDHVVQCINQLVTVPLNQAEFDAICSFSYNCGCHAFATSTLLTLLNAGDITGAAAEFDKWDHCSGKVVAGLLRRRQAETDLFSR